MSTQSLLTSSDIALRTEKKKLFGDYLLEAMAFQAVIKLLLIINLIRSISGLNEDAQLRFNGNAKRNADKVSATSNKISKLRLILLSDLKPNEIVRCDKCDVISFHSYMASQIKLN